ncbi:hypothetical protein AVEN_249516-1 [Araneus ventricosus]|uniref:Uncharacterized protein n=1 Tax=Araneus ventricosus TaxID=182803 RepID=A0A4Y2HNK8_ARAVE|nr:hypothetical protein AVEN_249516-1 [Araneus ventricosus]
MMLCDLLSSMFLSTLSDEEITLAYHRQWTPPEGASAGFLIHTLSMPSVLSSRSVIMSTHGVYKYNYDQNDAYNDNDDRYCHYEAHTRRSID